LLPLLVLFVHGQGGMQRITFSAYDFLFKLRGERPPLQPILVVAQDDATVDHYGIRLSDWPRSWHAELIRHLDEAGAELIVFDYDFSQPTEPEEDAAFAAALADAGNVILTNHLRADGTITEPLPRFSRHTLGEGLINTVLDPDGFWRRLPYAAIDADGYLRFSLPLTVVEIYEDFPLEQRQLDHEEYLGWGSHRLPYPDLRINFRGPAGTIPTLSYHAVMEGKFHSDEIRGQIVLVGNTHRLGKDFFAVPTDPRMTGVEVYAHAVGSILGDDFIRAVQPPLLYTLTVLAGLLAGVTLFLPRIGIVIGVTIAATTVGATLLATYLLFSVHHLWLDSVPIVLAAVANFAAAGTVQWSRNRRRAAQIQSVFGRYVSKNVVNVILARDEPVELTAHTTEATVLFSDIRGFTSLSEALPPEAVGRFLNRYFEEMIQCVFAEQGTLDKLMGDAVMAFFGAPLSMPDHPLHACQCALRMERRLQRLVAGGVLPEEVSLEIGIGINSGEVIAGNLGSVSFIDYTVIGDNVNLGSRLEGLNKLYGTRIIISESTHAAVAGKLPCRELDSVQVKGKQAPTVIYELIAPDCFNDERKRAMEAYARGLAQYRRANWSEAIRHLDTALQDHPADTPAKVLRAKCLRLMERAPDAGWSGVTVLDSK